MSELEVSNSLPQLTDSETKARTEQNKALGRNSAISLYLFVKQGGLQRAGMGLDAYCAEVYGVDGRTGRYWIQQVTATLLAKNLTEAGLLAHWNEEQDLPMLLPVALSAEICRLPASEAVETYREWGKTRCDEKGSNKARVEDFKKIHARRFPHNLTVTGVTEKRMEEFKTAPSEAAMISELPKTERTEVIFPAVLADLVTRPEIHFVDVPEHDPMSLPGLKNYTLDIQPVPVSLTAVRAEVHPIEFYTVVWAVDDSGTEYVLDLPQRLLDLAPRKG